LMNAAVTASGAAHITATGGTLEIAHQLSDTNNLLTLTISGNSDKLLLDFNSAAKTVNFNGANGTLELNTIGQLIVGTQLAIGGGTVQLDSAFASLTDASGITLNGGSLQGV